MSSNVQNTVRVLFIKNLNFTVTGADLYELFSPFGAIRQIRLGNSKTTKGQAYVVFEEVADAKAAMDKLNGFHLQDRYLVLLYYQPSRQAAINSKAADLLEREKAVAEQKKLLGLD